MVNMVLKPNQQPTDVGILVVESAANTFTAAKIDLPIVLGQQVFDLDLVEIMLTSATPAAADDYGNYQIQIQKSHGTAPTALKGANDPDLLYYATVEYASGTEAADITFFNAVEIGAEHLGFAEFIVNDEVYFVIQGTANAGAITQKGRMRGSIETPSQQALNALVLSQLGS